MRYPTILTDETLEDIRNQKEVGGKRVPLPQAKPNLKPTPGYVVEEDNRQGGAKNKVHPVALEGGGNPHTSMTWRRFPQSMESKAVAKSSLKTKVEARRLWQH